MTDMGPDVIERLSAEFPPEAVGKLPKGGKELDYVGHGHVTKRLNEVDPFWTWYPMGKDEHGNPVLDEYGGIWIELQVAGVRKPGYGEPDRQKGTANGVKAAIGDAIRNAAMRFGVALDMWARDELEAATEKKPARKKKPQSSQTASKGPRKDASKKQATQVGNKEKSDSGASESFQDLAPKVEDGPLGMLEKLTRLEQQMIAYGWPENAVTRAAAKQGTTLEALSLDPEAMFAFATMLHEAATMKAESADKGNS